MEILENLNKDIRTIINLTYSDDLSWNYYSCDREITRLRIDEAGECKKFIRLYFKNAEKLELNTLLPVLNSSIFDYRAMHIVYVFLLGIYVYRNTDIIKKYVNQQIEKRFSHKQGFYSDVEFPFIWFLLCLIHDLGYKAEEDHSYSSFNDFMKKKKLEPLHQISGVPLLYKIYRQYYDYRIKFQKNDHGITAGSIMFNDLCRIRDEQEKKIKQYYSLGKKMNRLCWEKPLVKVYNFCAWIVLAHNIWFVRDSNEKDKNDYIQNNLFPLILNEGEYKISLKKYPIFFLLCLIDSIEPIKVVKDFSLLDNIFLNIADNKIIINTNLECGCNDKILNNAEGLSNWLTTAKRSGNYSIIDLIPQKKDT